MIRKLFVVLGTIGIVAGFVVFTMVLGSFRPQVEKTEPEVAPPAVFYTEVSSEPRNLFVYTQGEVQPRTDISLTAQVGGKVVRVADNFIDGGTIRKGDMLVQIEREDYRLAVTQAEARVAQALQALRLEEAEAELARQDWEDLGGLESGAEPSALTLRQPQLNQAKANYEAALADLRNAKLALSRTTIRAPFDGRIRRNNVDTGQFISPGTPVAEIFSTDIAEIRLPLTDTDLAKLGLPLAFTASEDNPGPRVELSATVAGQTRNWTGRITRTDAAIDPRTRQIAAIAEVADPYGAGSDNGFPLAMGLYVNAAIEGQSLPRAFVLPASALQTEDDVFVVRDDNTIEMREILIAATTNDGLIVIDGLTDGDRVLLARLPGATDGFEVTPLKPGETAPVPSGSDTEGSESAAAQAAGDGAVQ